MFNRKVVLGGETFKYGGTGADGALNVTSNVTISGGVKNYTTVVINSDCTLTISSNCLMYCKNSFTNNGTITVTPCGASGGNGATEQYGSGENGNRGVCGGRGGNGTSGETSGGYGGSVTGNLPSTAEEAITDYLTYKGAGGGGGGYSETSTSKYTERYYGCDGGTGGGCLVLSSPVVTNSGTISVVGGNYISNRSLMGGGGGGGVLVFIYRSLAQGTTNVGGGRGYQKGDDGSVVIFRE